MVPRQGLRSSEHPRRLGPIFVAHSLDPPEVGGRVNPEAAQVVHHDRALALVRAARQVPLLEGEALAARREPAPIRSADEPGRLEELLGVARVRPIPNRRRARDEVVVVLLGVAEDVSQDAGVVREGLQ